MVAGLSLGSPVLGQESEGESGEQDGAVVEDDGETESEETEIESAGPNEEYEEVQELKELEDATMSANTLGAAGWHPTILAPYSGALASLRRDSGLVAELYHGHKDVPVGAELLTIPAVRERFKSTTMFDLVEYNQPSVRAYLDFFDGRGKPVLAKWIERMGRFEPLIRKTLEEEGLPQDLIYVAMIESGFSPRAVSPASAVGVWQFIPTTGSEMGLAITRYVDERRDPVKATRAACKYFKLLYNKFGSWPLSMAAYNGGPGLVGNSVEKHNSNSYWFIQRQRGLYDETRRYVPKVLAAGLVTKNADVFGLEGIQKVEPFEFDIVEVPRRTLLRVFASAAGTDVSTLRDLNPELLRAQTPPGDGLYELRIPKGSTKKFVAKYDEIDADEAAHETHRLKFGQTLRDLAHELDVAPRVLRAANGFDSRERVSYGAPVLVPKEAKGKWRRRKKKDRRTFVVPKKNPNVKSGKRYFYRVNEGDTLDVVARGLGVKPGDLLLWNYLDPRAKLQDGMVLQVYAPEDLDRSTVALVTEGEVKAVVAGSTAHKRMKRKKRQPKRFYHRVKSGESLWLIARKYRTTVKKLKRWNRKVRRSNTLQPGQKIVVYPGRR